LNRIPIHNEVPLEKSKDDLPEGSVFKGYKMFTVQDLVFELNNTRYLQAYYKAPDGTYIKASLPEQI
jgi:hypothetical protein